MPIKNTALTEMAFKDARTYAINFRHQFITPEHLLEALFAQDPFMSALEECQCDTEQMQICLDEYLVNNVEIVSGGTDRQVEASVQFRELVQQAYVFVESSESETLDIPHLVQAMLQLPYSPAANLLELILEDKAPLFLTYLINLSEEAVVLNEVDEDEQFKSQPWRSHVTCLNECLKNRNPLIGREAELDRTIQVLCRKDKNNPLHVGEAGVGKTALAYGLAERIEAGNVPTQLQGCRIYMMDMGNMLSGTQYRGEFEKRIKSILEGALKEKKAIIYIDEIHNLIGAGRSSDNSLDASNMLKPYLEAGDIRFIGATTYEEYNKYFARHKALVRRFQQIDVTEPSIEETIRIIEGVKESYETFHGIVYEPDVIPYAVKMSAQHISNRFLPDKAIDLIDEAAAYRVIHPTTHKKQTVNKELIADVLASICKVDSLSMKEEETTSLKDLNERINALIYGQKEAVQQVVEAVQMAKAGLIDDNKPMSNLLFVGPTGVGKTEISKVLAAELGIALQRFDMSEYAEEHTVAKLFGSPAGYVGYNDGGLLTNAIRKTPNCVLLLDEIEKAHPKVFDTLLQVMDYATLTDSKGQKSDFRHVILIMTSNAGAQYAHQASIGFGSTVKAGESMLKQVKKTFKPEFLNRLTATVVFHDMDNAMASLILDKKLRELNSKLAAKKIEMELSEEARGWILQRGFLPEYGAREMDRVISSKLKPLLMHEILFGYLKEGGKVCVQLANDQLVLAPVAKKKSKPKKSVKSSN